MLSSSSSSSWLHSHLKTAGAGAVQSLFPLLLQYGPAGRPAREPSRLLHRLTPFLLWMSPALAAQALPPSHGTHAPGEG